MLRHLVTEAGRGQFAIVVVSGVPGSGKTSMLDWTATMARESGNEVLWASGYESSLPFAALSRLAEPFRELAGWLRSSPAEEAVDLPLLIVEAFAARATRRPLVVVLDDVHDLQDASRAVLGDVVLGLDDRGARGSLPMLVVLSARSPLDPDGLAGRVVRLRAARSITMTGLDDGDLTDLLGLANVRLDPADRRSLLERTCGLPLLVASELRRQAVRDGDSAADVPERVRSITDELRSRFDDIPEPARHLLRRAAVLGDPWDIDELAVVVGQGRREDTSGRRLRRTGPPRRPRWPARALHPPVGARRAGRRAVAAEQAREHRIIAERLREHYAVDGRLDDDLHVRVMDHLLRAGDGAVTSAESDDALRAGRLAMGWSAYGEAARFLRASAVASGATPPPTWPSGCSRPARPRTTTTTTPTPRRSWRRRSTPPARQASRRSSWRRRRS